MSAATPTQYPYTSLIVRDAGNRAAYRKGWNAASQGKPEFDANWDYVQANQLKANWSDDWQDAFEAGYSDYPGTPAEDRLEAALVSVPADMVDEVRAAVLAVQALPDRGPLVTVYAPSHTATGYINYGYAAAVEFAVSDGVPREAILSEAECKAIEDEVYGRTPVAATPVVEAPVEDYPVLVSVEEVIPEGMELVDGILLPLEAPEPAITLQWENGVFVSHNIRMRSKPAAFAYLDYLLRDAEYPDSLHIIISSDGEPVWAQFGYSVYLNV